MLPPQYYVGNKWFKILPLPTTSEKPTIIQSMHSGPKSQKAGQKLKVIILKKCSLLGGFRGR